jgi:hypothetical protein
MAVGAVEVEVVGSDDGERRKAIERARQALNAVGA